jgi:hypothetical protein
MVPALALSIADDHLELERVVVANAPDFNHAKLHRYMYAVSRQAVDWRVSIVALGAGIAIHRARYLLA